MLTDNNVNLLNLTHNQLMNGGHISMNDIKKRAWELSLDDVNNAIRKHLREAPIVHIKAGDYSNSSS